jgi:hypothetical protein
MKNSRRVRAILCSLTVIVVLSNLSGCDASTELFQSIKDTVEMAAGPALPEAPVDLLVTGVTDTSIAISWEARNGAASYTVFRRRVDGGAFAVVDVTESTAHVSTGLTPYTEYAFYVVASNVAGDSEPSPTVFQMTPDTGKPPAPSVIGVVDGTTYTSNQSFTLGLIEDAALEVKFSLDDGATFLDYAGPVTLSEEGSHTITAYQVDAAGNASDWTPAVTVVIDKTPAVITSFSIDGPATFNGTNLVADLSFQVEGATAVTIKGNGKEQSVSPSQTSIAGWVLANSNTQGTYTVEIVATDGVHGPVVASDSIFYNKPPSGTIALLGEPSGSSTVTTDNYVRIDLSGIEDANEYSWRTESGSYSGYASIPSSPVGVSLGYGTGTRTVYARVRDPEGNTHIASRSITYTPDFDLIAYSDEVSAAPFATTASLGMYPSQTPDGSIIFIKTTGGYAKLMPTDGDGAKFRIVVYYSTGSVRKDFGEVTLTYNHYYDLDTTLAAPNEYDLQQEWPYGSPTSTLADIVLANNGMTSGPQLGIANGCKYTLYYEP